MLSIKAGVELYNFGAIRSRLGKATPRTFYTLGGDLGPLRGVIYRVFWEMDEGGSTNWVSLSEEALCGGPPRRAPLLKTLGYERKALGTGISLHGGSVGQPGVGFSTGEIWEMAEWCSGFGASFFTEALWREPGGSAPLLDTLVDR